jgi:DsbC/DsbD-like thiol-disulfide interchange protein
MIKTLTSQALVFLFLLSVNGYSFEQEIPDPIQIKIFTNSEIPKPGDKIKVGVHFKLDPGWHIYWKNSGDSGLPTKVKHTVPKGFEIKETQYPVPKTLLREGNILDYGYEDELLLITDIYVPKDATNSSFKIKSEARWVVCREVCIPGNKELELQFPITKKAVLGDNSFFNVWHSQLPKKISKNKLPFKYSVQKKFSDENKLNFISITFNWDEEVKDVNIFPNIERSVYLKDIVLKNDRRTSSYSFSPVIFKKGENDIEEIEFVISYKDSDGQIRRIETIINLKG